MIVGTAGHIDHGKTTLVRALTGVDTDRLKEEKERGISIELGYAYVPLANGEMLGFVDVPGHERLIQTMAAGATGIDFALLVIAADDGVMPQTREHLAILDLLGVAQGAVALTKIDRVDDARIAEVQAQIGTLLDASPLRDAPIFGLNALQPAHGGLKRLREHLHAAAIARRERNSAGLFRLAIDRVFSLAGHGTVVTGTAHAGTIRVGDSVCVMPRGLVARVRSIHSNHRESATGRTGERCALNLAGVEKSEIARGDWLADARAFLPSVRIDVSLRTLGSAPLLRNWAPVHVHLGAAHRLAHLVPLEGDALAPGASARAQLVFDAPFCAAVSDRFIVRDAQARNTLGGGRVLDANAPARKRRSAERRQYLDAIEALLDHGDLSALLRSAPYGLAVADLERICSMPADALALPADAHAVEIKQDRHIVALPRWHALAETALAALAAYHAQSPDEAGVELARLRRIAVPTMPDSLWRALIDELVTAQRILRNGPWLHLPEHRVAMSADELQLATRLLPLIEAGSYDPPWVRDLAASLAAPEARVRQTLRKLAAQGGVHQIVPDLFYSKARVQELAVILEQLANENGEVEAAAFRDRIGLGRKRTIQILEFFDRVGYTRRLRNAHRLRADRQDFFNPEKDE